MRRRTKQRQRTRGRVDLATPSGGYFRECHVPHGHQAAVASANAVSPTASRERSAKIDLGCILCTTRKPFESSC